MSENELEDVSIVDKMPHLLTYNASKNQIADINFLSNEKAFQYLQIANFEENKVKELPKIVAPYLRQLNLFTNEITTCEAFTGHLSLTVLNLAHNQLTNTTGLANMP